MNTRKKYLLEQLATYFISKGKILTEKEYKEAKDTPIRFFFIKRKIGNWAKLLKLLKTNSPEVFELLNKPKVKPVVKKPITKPVIKPKVEVKNEE